MARAFVLLLLAIAVCAPCCRAGTQTNVGAPAKAEHCVETEGVAAMGDERSRKQTEDLALDDAKRRAAQRAATYIRSETKGEDYQVKSDVLEAYSNAVVKVLEVVSQGWYKDPDLGECFKVRIRAEVTPDEQGMADAARQATPGDPADPIHVRLWSDRGCSADKTRVYLWASELRDIRLRYRDARGKAVLVQPNPDRRDSYFYGRSVYEVPSGLDHFDLLVSSPSAPEKVTLHAGGSTSGARYVVKAKPEVEASVIRVVRDGSGWSTDAQRTHELVTSR